MSDVLISVGDHSATAVPPALPDDDHLAGQECIRGANDGADVQIVPPVLDSHGKRLPARIEIGDDRLDRPVPVAIHDIATVAVGKQFGVKARIFRPRLRMRADPDIRHDSPRSAKLYIERYSSPAARTAEPAPRSTIT